MNIEEFRTLCLSFKNVTEEFPFDGSTLVFKANGKMFALTDVNNFDFINLKCESELNEELRERYQGIKPGYHMHKKHWNSVYVQSDVPEKLLYELIKKSYDLVYREKKK